MRSYASRSKNRPNSSSSFTNDTHKKVAANSGYLNMLSNDSGVEGFDEKMLSRMIAAQNNQRPNAEKEADRIAAGISPTASIEDVKSQLGQKLGADFSDIRIHTGAAAASKADSIGAKAFTQGRDVYLGSGGYDATTAAHELVHTVQQGVVSGTGVSEAVPVGTVQMKPWGIFSKIKNFFSGKSKKNPNMLKKGAFNDRFNDMDNETKLDELTKLGSYINARRELKTDNEDDFADYNNTYLSVLQQASANKDFRDLMYQRASAAGSQLHKDSLDYDSNNYTMDIFNGPDSGYEKYRDTKLGAVGYSQNATNFKALSRMFDDGKEHFLNGNQRLDLTMQGSSSTDPRADARRNIYRGREAIDSLYQDNTKGNLDELNAKNNAIVSGYQLPGGPPQKGKRKRRK